MFRTTSKPRTGPDPSSGRPGVESRRKARFADGAVARCSCPSAVKVAQGCITNTCAAHCGRCPAGAHPQSVGRGQCAARGGLESQCVLAALAHQPLSATCGSIACGRIADSPDLITRLPANARPAWLKSPTATGWGPERDIRSARPVATDAPVAALGGTPAAGTPGREAMGRALRAVRCARQAGTSAADVAGPAGAPGGAAAFAPADSPRSPHQPPFNG